MKTVSLNEQRSDRLVQLMGVDGVEKGEGDPVLQVRVGPAAGPLLEGTIAEIREIAGNFGITGSAYPDGDIEWPIGGGVIKGKGSQFSELGAQIGLICHSVETEHRPVEMFVNIGTIGK